VFVYRLLDDIVQQTFRLRDLDVARTYALINIDKLEASPPVSGSELLTAGLMVELPQPNRAAIFILEAV
jgi:hypothetical protein